MCSALDRTCPNGIDAYFDNTGGEIFDNVMLRINKFVWRFHYHYCMLSYDYHYCYRVASHFHYCTAVVWHRVIIAAVAIVRDRLLIITARAIVWLCAIVRCMLPYAYDITNTVALSLLMQPYANTLHRCHVSNYLCSLCCVTVLLLFCCWSCSLLLSRMHHRIRHESPSVGRLLTTTHRTGSRVRVPVSITCCCGNGQKFKGFSWMVRVLHAFA